MIQGAAASDGRARKSRVLARRSGQAGSIRLGFAVKVLGDGGLPSHDTRRWQSDPHLSVSLELPRPHPRLLRRPSSIRHVPDGDRARPVREPPRASSRFRQPAAGLRQRPQTGRRQGQEALDIRLSTHPGQYTVLNSEDERTATLARDELEVQAELLDAIGIGPDAVVVLHVGSAAGARRRRSTRFDEGLRPFSPMRPGVAL